LRFAPHGCRHRIRTHPQLGDDQRRTDAMGKSSAWTQLLVRMIQGTPGKVVFRHRQHAGKG
jgi:hypothetical protein